MSADLSRVRWNPRRDDHSGTGLQQGRLLLDADYNEQVAIVDRRLRAHVVDLAATTPAVVSAATPDAFLLGWSGPKLTIGRGRMYVDGLLAENHGVDPPVFDPVLAETNGGGDLDYLTQPYWPTPTPLPDKAGPHLAYLDVWDREVTVLEDPSLVEIAVGVDTTTRWQTVWQVRIYENAGDGVSCATPDNQIPGWSDWIAPSGVRLSTGTVPVDPADDPCELPPTGGYRGLENHLYRVQIHDGGAKPTFLWSRENASVGSAVVEVTTATQLRLAGIGRDDLLRINDDDWVEILDDHREFDQLPGDLRKVTVDEDTATITFSPALSADLIPTGVGDDTAAARHLRVRRWDSALIPVPAAGTPTTLEFGLTVTFDTVAGARSGDHWVFAARSADASVEALVAEPPRGVHHHYARLAILTGPGSAPSDCRPMPPVAGGTCPCEICVDPLGKGDAGAAIQKAIDTLVAAGGGTVSLCPGTYPLRQPLRIEKALSIRLTGHGEATVLVSEGSAVQVLNSVDILLDHFAVHAGGSDPAIGVTVVENCRVEDVTVIAENAQDSSRAAIGLSSIAMRTAVRRCALSAPVGVGVVADPRKPDKPPALYTLGLSIEDNLMACARIGVDLSGVVVHYAQTRITGNTVYRTTDAGIGATGLVGHDLDPASGASIDGTLEISGNDVTTSGGQGIVTRGDAVIRDNTVTAANRVAGGHGIVVMPAHAAKTAGQVQIIGNRITGPGGRGIMVGASLRSLLIKQNTVSGAAEGILVSGAGATDHIAVDNNQIIALTAPPAGPDPDDTLALSTAYLAGGTVGLGSLRGIAVGGGASVGIVGNVVDGIDPAGAGAAVGIMVTACVDTHVHDNLVTRIGTPAGGEDGPATGILVVAPGRSLSVHANTVHGSDEFEPVPRAGWQALVVGGAGGALAPVVGHIALDGVWAYAAPPAGPVSVTGNIVQGGQDLAAMSIGVTGEVIVRANHSTQPRDADMPAIEVTAPAAVVEGNRARGGRPSIRLAVPLANVLPLGNMTTGDIRAGTGTTPPTDPVMGSTSGKAWSQLNSIVP